MHVDMFDAYTLPATKETLLKYVNLSKTFILLDFTHMYGP